MTTVSHNTPGIPPLTQEERTYVEAALEAMQSLKKTFEFWMAIAQGLKSLRDKADQIGGRFTFDRLREREGLGPEVVNKTRVSRLLTILERRAEVEKWRATLSSNQRFEWASPESVWNHCPIFHSPGENEKPPKPSRIAELERINAELQQEIHRLKQNDGGSLFDIKKDSAPDIARVIVGTIGETKVRALITALNKQLKTRQAYAG
jgi:hypothetical protein